MQSITGALTDDGESSLVYIDEGETITASLTVAGGEQFEGVVAVELSRDGINFAPAKDTDGVDVLFTGTVGDELTGSVFSGTLTNTEPRRMVYRVRATGIAQDGVSYALAEVVGDRTGVILRDKNGRAVAWTRDDGSVEFDSLVAAVVNGSARAGLDVLNLQGSEAVTTSDAAPTALSIAVYQSILTTGGSAGAEEAEIGDGTGAVVGQRKLITLESLGDPGDSVALDDANIVADDGSSLSAVTMDAEGAFLLLEWNGTAWQTLYSGDCTLTP